VMASATQLAAAESGRADVSAAVRSLTSIAAMVDRMNGIYTAIAAPATAPDLAALKRAAMNHLDSRFFRKELLRLQGDLDAAEQQRDNALQELKALAGEFARRGEWIDHLQQGIDGLREHIAGQPSVDTLRQENAQLKERVADFELLQARHAALEQAHASLQTAYDTLKRRVTWPLRLLPAPVRAWVMRMVKRKFFVEGRNG
jgi:chromosome segregation ATPase